MKKFFMALLIVTVCVRADVFDEGTMGAAVTVGSGTGYNSTYTILGISANYFMLNGLSVGVGYRGWFGGTPTMNEIDLPVTYYVPLKSNVRPYGGVFYRYTFVSGDYSDYNTYGARAGISYVQGRGYFAAGWAQEWYENAEGNKGTNGYPEIMAGISF